MGWMRAKSSVSGLPMAFSRSQTHADFIGAITPTRVRVARLRIRAVRGMCSARASHTSGLSSCSEGIISQVMSCALMSAARALGSAVLACS